ncbi:Protocadherin-9 Precursor [Triplophysa tibetana]|uniref:Protocadherin-9 n=1 Tax=Triplophysa tibetana TaxID=1572043 RepID=A0A5A9NXA3_9TELE|nr:Protocadherin-9 Precursor [Triplophysa tibetana]
MYVALAQPPLYILSSVIWLSLPQRHVYRLLSISDSNGLENPRGVTLRITFIEPDVMLAQSQGPFVLAGWACASRCSANGLGGRRRQRVHGPLGPRGLVEATEMCTQECLVLGHSDNCWMPPSLSSYPSPKSPVSSFNNQKEWAKERLLNGHTLTRSWKGDRGSQEQYGDRKTFGGSEGHFGSGGHMADIPLASLKSYQPASGSDSPKEQQL